MSKDLRHACRIIPFTIDGKVLLIKGHDIDNCDYSWWFTIGGGRNDDESDIDCAIRELFEETGIKVARMHVSEPFIFRNGKFEFTNKVIFQKETIFFSFTI